MTFQPAKKNAILMPTSSLNYLEKHLFVILTDPFPHPDNPSQDTHYNLIVNISTAKENKKYDTTCVIHPGEHSFITRKSFVYYKFAKDYETQNIIDGLKSGTYEKYSDLRDELFERIKNGLLSSRNTKRRIKRIYDDAMIPF